MARSQGMTRPCPCGSGLPSRWKHDARGIPLARVCVKCIKKTLGRYRRDVLTNPNYICDEPIESES